MCLCLSDLCLIILSIFFPPLPVWIRRGICSTDSFINILLCMLGFFPGLIHSWYIIAKYPPYYDNENQKIYYVYRNDLENQTPIDHHHHHHHHDSHHGGNERTSIRNEPNGTGQIAYGAINENSSNSGNNNNSLVTAPPKYSEFDNKTQH
ncbi:uncharacterized protein KGF55_000405 [Candida pseudojiufengensis]|uniref:uncharacterized protein n=1 Tax=Candida pseudojiufengensis TaxID=497109 RepID=UPI0022252147|nr:uncharacterized protein KGF55_000405 [Candida pseudojiufengensis]KAI5966996.1 hypothetical protein KGF55_000405 [Candida pseudojiufengensis]